MISNIAKTSVWSVLRSPSHAITPPSQFQWSRRKILVNKKVVLYHQTPSARRNKVRPALPRRTKRWKVQTAMRLSQTSKRRKNQKRRYKYRFMPSHDTIFCSLTQDAKLAPD